MNRIVALIVISAALTGCTSTYHMEVLKSPDRKFLKTHSITIQTPKNGYYGEQEYVRSGQMTADAFKSEFLRYASNVTIDPKGKLSFSNPSNTYYVRPEILQWEERATEWSGRRDKIKIKVDVYDMKTKSQQSSVIFSGKSKWATFGGDHPQDLLPKPIRDYLKTLY